MHVCIYVCIYVCMWLIASEAFGNVFFSSHTAFAHIYTSTFLLFMRSFSVFINNTTSMFCSTVYILLWTIFPTHSIFLIRLKFGCFFSVPSHGRQVAQALRELSEIVSFLKLEHAKKFKKIAVKPKTYALFRKEEIWSKFFCMFFVVRSS